jgi:large subunit ribosomal protein L7e
MRIRGIYDIAHQQKQILNKLKLKSVNSAVFLKGNTKNLKLLKKVENYITYGVPSPKIVRELIYKKMYGKVGK